ncbi:hypothetical protein AMP1_1 [Burkholderia phage AMP1]|uniref:Uncharacterized protein n=1 Tax=Burkholderia phage AMP1 TaxID=2601683 RepID=A0A5C2IBJ5_9CAUD|nr:hypothetical protein AMP1_1 [Burkholderia phage AMP1]
MRSLCCAACALCRYLRCHLCGMSGNHPGIPCAVPTLLFPAYTLLSLPSHTPNATYPLSLPLALPIPVLCHAMQCPYLSDRSGCDDLLPRGNYSGTQKALDTSLRLAL